MISDTLVFKSTYVIKFVISYLSINKSKMLKLPKVLLQRYVTINTINVTSTTIKKIFKLTLCDWCDTSICKTNIVKFEISLTSFLIKL